MAVTKSQRVRLAGRASIPWSESIEDPRKAQGRRHGHHGMLGLMAVAFACGQVVLRRMEDLSSDLSRLTRRSLALPKKVSDTALYRLLAKQRPEGFRETVWASVRELWEKKVVQHDLFPVGVISFDGKSIWSSLLKKLAGAKESTCDEAGTPFWSFSSFRAVLTSCSARLCLDMELIAAKEGESPAFRVVFRRMVEHFSKLFLIVTADAAMTCRENALLVAGAKKHYLFALKANQDRVFSLAERWFLAGGATCRARTSDDRGGVRVDRELFSVAVHDNPEVDFTDAQHFWCVRQVTFDRDGNPASEELRYFISSIPHGLLKPHEQLALVRLHWGIENGHNWTVDMMLGEDDHQPCQASADSIEVVCWLRIIGYNILATWRCRRPKKDRKPLSWKRAMQLLRDAWVGAFIPEGAPAFLP